MKLRASLKKRTITGKIISVSMIQIILMALAIAIPFGVLSYRAELKNLEDFEHTLREDYDAEIRHEVETVFSLIKGLNDKYEEGVYTFDEARLLAADIVRGLSYGDGGYFWVDKSDGTNVVLLGLDAEGKNRYDMQDANGTYFIRDIIKAAMNGGGYSEYWFPKKGTNVPLPKRSY
ncbi:hypothetical protein E9993_09715 [Labilibacter sediminis]|nr:hypothetical protein E9993_09715 [Labilibacter sediminis]